MLGLAAARRAPPAAPPPPPALWGGIGRALRRAPLECLARDPCLTNTTHAWPARPRSRSLRSSALGGGGRGGAARGVWVAKNAGRHVAHQACHLSGPVALPVCGRLPRPMLPSPLGLVVSKLDLGSEWGPLVPLALHRSRYHKGNRLSPDPVSQPSISVGTHRPHGLSRAFHEQSAVRHWRGRCPGPRSCWWSGEHRSTSFLYNKRGSTRS